MTVHNDYGASGYRYLNCETVWTGFRGAIVELKAQFFLYTMAGLMVTFAGFSALLFAVRQAAVGGCRKLTDTLQRRAWRAFRADGWSTAAGFHSTTCPKVLFGNLRKSFLANDVVFFC